MSDILRRNRLLVLLISLLIPSVAEAQPPDAPSNHRRGEAFLGCSKPSNWRLRSIHSCKKPPPP